MRIVWVVQSWSGISGPQTVAHEVAAAAQHHAPHAEASVYPIGDGGPRSADVWSAASRERVGGAEVVRRGRTAWLTPANGAARWDPLGLSAALIGIASAGGAGARVVVPVGDTAPAGDAAALWGPSISAFRHALTPLDVLTLVTSDRPLLGFHGMSAALLDGREHDTAMAQAAQAQEERWAGLALEADAVAGVASLLGPTRPSDVPGTGAAGGLAYALHVAGARLAPAFPTLIDTAGVADALASADVVVTVAEDLTPRTLDHGLSRAVGAAAATHGIPAVVLTSALHVGKRDLMAAGIEAAHASGDGTAGLSDGVRRVLQTWARGEG